VVIVCASSAIQRSLVRYNQSLARGTPPRGHVDEKNVDMISGLHDPLTEKGMLNTLAAKGTVPEKDIGQLGTKLPN
jgi:hypothetical protein